MDIRGRTLEALGVMQDFWNLRRVLLTGHTGFKGSWLALWLSEMGASVSGVGLDPDTKPNLFHQLELSDRIDRHQIGDIRDIRLLEQLVNLVKPQIVFHLAAQPLVRQSYRDPLGTWSTNVQGCLNLLEALKQLEDPCAVVMVTTDKVYENLEWDYGYRECDRLGGSDPYSASKAAAELAIASWRKSFCGISPHQTPNLAIATARSGNVIGGGDWSDERIIPDAIRSLSAGRHILVRNPTATRPWQHVLEPLSGYIRLAEALAESQLMPNPTNSFCDAYNFGPLLSSNRSVRDLVAHVLDHWEGGSHELSDDSTFHEAGRLQLQIDKANHPLGWQPRWSFETCVQRAISWYKNVHEGQLPIDCCLNDLHAYQN